MSTIKDVAKLAGLSISTVSRFLNNTVPVSKDAERHIDDAVKKLNYVPNTYAGQLKKKHSNFIAMVVPDIRTPIFSEVITKLEHRFKEHGFVLILFNTSHKEEITKEVVKNIISYRAYAVIVMGRALFSHNLESLKQHNVNTLLIEDNLLDLNHILWDNHRVGYEQTKYLHKHGQKNILFAGKIENIPVTMKRFAGYKEYIETHQLPFIEPVNVMSFDIDEMLEALTVEKLEKIDGVVCSNDMIAFAILKFAFNNNIRIPDDISIIGCDNNPYTGIVNPPLTTIQFPINELTDQVVNYFFKNTNFEVDELPVEIVERESVK